MSPGQRSVRLRSPGRVAAALFVLGAMAVRAEVCDDCADDDGDALVDCYDPDCFTFPACATTFLNALPSAPDCAPALALRLLWTSPLGFYDTVPAIGDVDGDGMPEVVFTTLSGDDRLVVLDGATGALERESLPLPGPLWHGQVAIGDVDLDGTAEIFAGEPCGLPGASSAIRFEHDAGRTWEDLTCSTGDNWNGGIALADFDSDGRPEVFQFGNVHDAVDGTRRVRVDGIDWMMTAFTVAADVLPDEACARCEGLELVASTSVWAIDVLAGTSERAAQVRGGAVKGYPVIVDWNGDGRLDVATLVRNMGYDGNEVIVWDPRTELVLAWGSLGDDLSGSVPSIADFDGDRELEIALVTYIGGSSPIQRVVRVLDHDMSVLRDIPIEENSEWITVTSFDFDADGASEVVVRDMYDVRVMSVLDDSIRLAAPCPSGTSGERAVVVDVDADGQADIVSGCDDSIGAWTVDGSVAARRVMNQWTYDVVNVEDDLTVACVQQSEGAAGLPPGVNGSIHQVPLMMGGRSPAEICRCTSKPIAAAAPPAAACPGTRIVLDASASAGCSSDRLYRWTDDEGRVVGDWTSDPTLSIVVGDSASYVVTIACNSDTWCQSSAFVPVDVLPGGDEPSALDRFPSAEPLRVTKTTDPLAFKLTWEDTGATSYHVYGGQIADLAPARPRPQPLACGLSVPGVDLPAPGPGWWFVAVCACGTVETSYGRDSFGIERTHSTAPCP